MSNNKKAKLVDCVERARQFPKTFEIPGPVARTTLRVGDLVKVIFEGAVTRRKIEDRVAEKIWVRVVAVNGGRYSGALANDPLSDLIPRRFKFDPWHVCAIDRLRRKGAVR